MKAITCSQCGALIKGISAKKEFADCRYCGAEIPVRLEKIFEVPDKENESPPVAEKSKVTVYKGVFEEEVPDFEQNPDKVLKVSNFFATLAGIILFAIIMYLSFSKNINKPTNSTKTPNYFKTTSTPYPTPIIPPIPVDTSTPYPDFSYRAYVKHFTNIGVEDVVIPTIEADQLPTMNLVELKKTVFKEKRIRVRIVINPDGEVIEAKALNGHPVLQEICLIAAKKSLFTTRKKNYTTDLTYIFVIEG